MLDWFSETCEAARKDLTTPVEIKTGDDFPSITDLALDIPRWHRIGNAVVVVTDLKGSTRISYAKQDRVGARLYQASTGHCARILNEFGAEFIDIQGDGTFGIFHGSRAHEAAIAAAFTLKSFSSKLAPMITAYLGDDAPEIGESGLKIGMADGTLLAKRVGVRGEHNEPVWAGKPVNYATKCAQAADRHDIVSTDRVFEHFKDQGYVTHSCGHSDGAEGVVRPLWGDFEVETLGDDSACKIFRAASSWCEHHGDEYCAAILAGDRRADLPEGIAPLRDPEPEPVAGE